MIFALVVVNSKVLVFINIPKMAYYAGKQVETTS